VLQQAGAALVVTQPELSDMMLSLGSPDALLEMMAELNDHVAPIVELRSQQIAPGDWVEEFRFPDGFAPYPEYCQLVRGMISVAPMGFGLGPADVAEQACQARGDHACRFRVRWEPSEGPAARAAFFEMRNQILEARLETFRRTVADLVTGDDLDAVLTRIVASTASAVSAPAYVLALEELPGASQRVYAEGLSPTDAAVLAAELLAEPVDALAGSADATAGRLVVEVASLRRRYGRLAAIHLHEGRFLDQEAAVLQVYARLAAAALDSATALEEARRQARTANTLLSLSSSLAEVVSTDEVAGKLVRALREIVDCDRATVVLVDEDTGIGHLTAVDGYEPEIADELRRLEITTDAQRQWLTSLGEGQGDGGPPPAGLAPRLPTAGRIGVPIVSGGELLGWISAAVATGPARLTADPEIPARLRGLAAQAATAIANARLLDRIRHQALHDALTGLPNRALILDRVERMLARTRRHHHRACALFLDLDGFKEINDTLGHAAGDQLLRAVAARLSATMRGSDSVGRLGGDEFIVLAETEAGDVDPELVAERILAVLQEPFQVAGTTVTVSASIGIASGDEDTTAGEMLRDADIALYQAKAAGKNRAVVFQPEMHAAVRDHRQLDSDVREALGRGELFLVYQPICDLATGRVTGVEALLRWRHPERGVVGPDVFIPLLEESGQIVEVGAWVLRRACRDVQALRAQGHDLDVAVNVSGRQLDRDGFVRVVEQALAETGLDAGALVVEITETLIMRDPEATAGRLHRIRDLGVRIAIDDFGTGYSSLALLRRFPVDSLKIDRSFIAAIRDSNEAEALVHMLVQLGKTLGLETVAEGIEGDDQLARLQREDCDSGQGFLIARPLELGALTEFLGRSVPLPAPTRSA
jgi:diguanylate cyclase (GGDEF)-like protein